MATQLQGCFKMKSSFHARSVTIPVGPLANLQQHCSIWILHHSLRHSFVHVLSWLFLQGYIKLSFHPNPHHSQTYIKNFQGTGVHQKQTWIMNLQVASSAQSTAFCILLQAIWMQKFEQTSTTSTLTAGFWLASPNSEVAISKNFNWNLWQMRWTCLNDQSCCFGQSSRWGNWEMPRRKGPKSLNSCKCR